jgi:hypothetical protein
MMVRAIGRLGNLAAPTKHSGRDRPCAIMVGLICGEGDSLWRFFYRQVSNVSAGRGVRAFGEFEDDIRAGRFGFNWFGLRSVAVLRKPDHAVARNDSIDGCARESETRANFAERFASDQCLSDWVDNVQSVYRAAIGGNLWRERINPTTPGQAHPASPCSALIWPTMSTQARGLPLCRKFLTIVDDA